MKCKICGLSCASYRILGCHIRNIHKIPTESYYNRYLKKNKNEGKCLMCGKKTAFLSLSVGYQPYCCKRCSDISPIKKRHTEQTNLIIRGCKNPFQDKKVQKKIVKTLLRTRGVTNPSYDKKVLAKIKQTKKERYGDENYNNREKAKKTCKELFGYEIASKAPSIKKKTEHINLQKQGYISTALNPDIKKKQQRTLKRHLGVTTPFASKIVQKKSRKTRKERTGYEYTLQNPKMVHNILAKKRKELGGYDSESERTFAKMLRRSKIRFRSHIDFNNNELHHQFDFAIFKNNKLNCLVEIDGEYNHGLKSDCDGKYVQGEKDYIRQDIVPNKVKFLVIDSTRLNEGLQELIRILKLSYTRWRKEIKRNIPRSIEKAFPEFSEKRMKSDYEKLCSYTVFNRNAFLGKSILLNFCKSRLYSLSYKWNILRSTLYKSPCSLHHLFEGFNLFENTCTLKTKYENNDDNIIIVKHHSPEKMISICSLGKIYVSKEPIDEESKKIIKFLNLNAYEITQ